jgi:hypothetical protein
VKLKSWWLLGVKSSLRIYYVKFTCKHDEWLWRIDQDTSPLFEDSIGIYMICYNKFISS